MPETRPQPEYHDHTPDAAGVCTYCGDSLTIKDHRPSHPHNWVDITTHGSPITEWLCAGCGLTRTEPRTHWPLYPEDACVHRWTYNGDDQFCDTCGLKAKD